MKILITQESYQTIRLNIHSPGPAYGYCDCCSREVQIVTLEHAAWITGIGVRNILHKIDEQLIHAIETDSGLILVCLDSLRQEKNAVARSCNES